MTQPADWQLPPGVDRPLWGYLTDAATARGYDAALAGTLLLETDLRFCAEVFDRPGRLLDLGCGTGRLLVPFAGRGFECVGADLSAEMLAVTGDKAAAAGVRVGRLRLNLADLSALRDGSFDYAACLFSTLGMVVGSAARRSALAHAYRVLRPGGRFVLHVHNRRFAPLSPAGRAGLVGDALARLAGREPGDRRMPPHRGLGPITLHLFTRGEAVAAVRAAGFRVRAVRAVGLTGDGYLRRPWLLGAVRAYGYLIAAEKTG